jgi:sortase A
MTTRPTPSAPTGAPATTLRTINGSAHGSADTPEVDPLAEAATAPLPSLPAQTPLALSPQQPSGPGSLGLPVPVMVPARPSRQRVRPQGALAAVGTATLLIGLVLVLFLVYTFGAGYLVQQRAQRAQLAELEQKVALGPQQPAPDEDGNPTLLPTPAYGESLALLEIPTLGLIQVVAEGTRPSDLVSGPGHLRSSAGPGEIGNVVIMGRRTAFGGPFADLGELRKGDEVVLTTERGRFVYEMVATVRVEPGDVDGVTATQDARLTLITADPPLQATRRLVAVAALTTTPVATIHERPRSLGASELGSTADPLGLALLLLWGQLLALAIYGARRLYRSWTRRSTYLVTTPVIAALGLLTFEALLRLLPGTL